MSGRRRGRFALPAALLVATLLSALGPADLLAGDVLDEPPVADPEWQVAIPSGRGSPRGNEQLVTWAGGFAALGRDEREGLRVWVSEDGLDWRAHDTPLEARRFRVLAAHRDGLALVETTVVASAALPRHLVSVWRSPNGRRWRHATDGSRVFGAPDPRCALERLQAASAGDRLVVLATCTTGGAGGWTRPALLAAPASHRQPPFGAVFAWSTRDGRSWRRDRVRGVTGVLHALTPGPEGLLAIDARLDGPALVSSVDGVRWERAGALPEHAGRLAVADHGPVVAGTDWDGEVTEWTGFVWTGDPSGGWVAREVVSPAWLRSVHAEGDLLVVGGERFGPAVRFVLVGGRPVGVVDVDDPIGAFVLASTDGGETWAAADLRPLTGAGCVTEVAVRDGVAVALLGCRRGRGPLAVAARLVPVAPG
jgi:hypothetical protein